VRARKRRQSRIGAKAGTQLPTILKRSAHFNVHYRESKSTTNNPIAAASPPLTLSPPLLLVSHKIITKLSYNIRYSCVIFSGENFSIYYTPSLRFLQVVNVFVLNKNLQRHLFLVVQSNLLLHFWHSYVYVISVCCQPTVHHETANFKVGYSTVLQLLITQLTFDTTQCIRIY